MTSFEIGTPDPSASAAHHGALFDWETGDPSMPDRYSTVEEIIPMIDNG